jgi:hypothetical protein
MGLSWDLDSSVFWVVVTTDPDSASTFCVGSAVLGA